MQVVYCTRHFSDQTKATVPSDIFNVTKLTTMAMGQEKISEKCSLKHQITTVILSSCNYSCIFLNLLSFLSYSAVQIWLRAQSFSENFEMSGILACSKSNLSFVLARFQKRVSMHVGESFYACQMVQWTIRQIHLPHFISCSDRPSLLHFSGSSCCVKTIKTSTELLKIPWHLFMQITFLTLKLQWTYYFLQSTVSTQIVLETSWICRTSL